MVELIGEREERNRGRSVPDDVKLLAEAARVRRASQWSTGTVHSITYWFAVGHRVPTRPQS